MSLETIHIESDLVTDQHVLILTNLEEATVASINKMIETFCDIDVDIFFKEEQDFYRTFVHPEDYSFFINHLKSFQNPDEKGEKEILVRLRNKEGSWDKFLFRNRRYDWIDIKKNSYALSLAHKVIEGPKGNKQLVEDEKNPKYDSLKKEYQDLLESLDEAFCIIEMIFDKDNRPVDYLFLQTNSAFEKQINLKNVNGKTIRELIPDYREERLEKYGRVAQTGEPIRFEFCLEKLDNSWLDLYAFKTGEKNSQRIGIIFRNITQRKLAEEKLIKAKAELEQAKRELEEKAVVRQKNLEDSEQLLQTVFDTTNQAIAVYKILYNDDGTVKDFRFIKVNKVLQEMYLQDDPLGRTYLETTKYGVNMGIFDALKKVVETGEPLDNEFYFDKDDYHHWFRMTARPQKDLLIATIEDISERKAETEELRETVRFKQELVRASPETILIINLNTFSVRYINKDIFPEVGMTRERIEGMPLTEILPFIHPRDREKIMELHKKLLKSGDEDIVESELRLKLRNNSWEWFNVRGKVFHRRDANWVNEYVLLVRNITDQKNTQTALLKAEKFSIQGEVARTLAHELRSPLASFGMATQILKTKIDPAGEPELEKYFDILTSSTKRLNDLVSNLLNSSNYTPSVLEKENLAEIMNHSLHKAADRIYLSGINVIKNYTGPYFILADKEKLKIALLNIIVNASEATTPGEGIIEIEITEHDTDFKLSITDNGHGLEQEQIDRLFDAFYTNKSTGVGVGLSSVKNILEEHDAKIKVWSQPNEGARFELFFHNAQID